MLEQKDDGSLVVIPKIREKKGKKLELTIDENDLDIIHKLIVACYINPAESFKIHLKKKIDLITLLENKGLTSLESVEMDNNKVICESIPTVSDPQSLLRTSIRKIKNMLVIMMNNYNAELIARYEDEIDRNRLLISKSVVSALTYHQPSNLKTIDLYYIELISTYLEGLADHLIGIERTDSEFLESIRDAVDALQTMFENLGELDYMKAIALLKVVKKVKTPEVKDVKTYRKRRIMKYLESTCEIMLDWSITKEIEK